MNKRFEALDAFRGIAALMVAIFHFNVIGVISELTIIRNSFLFVDFFFVLSGFVISYSSIDKLNNINDVKSFSVKRFARIWPLHIFMVLLFIPFALVNIFVGVDFGDRFSLYSFIASFFLIQSFVMIGDSWNIPAWSISTEFYTYLIFAFLWLLPLFRNKLILSLAIIFISFIFIRFGFGINISIFRCLASFFLGHLAFRYYQKINVKPWMEWAILGAVISLLSYSQSENLTYIMPFLFFLLVVIFSHETGSISNILKGKHFQMLGVLSYSIYLTHLWFVACLKSLSIITDKLLHYQFMYTIDGVRKIDFGFGFNDFIFIPFLAIVIITSKFTYQFIEVKSQKYINDIYFNKTRSHKNR